MRRVAFLLLLAPTACTTAGADAPMFGPQTSTDAPGETSTTDAGSSTTGWTGADAAGSGETAAQSSETTEGGVPRCQPVSPPVPAGYHVDPQGSAAGNGSEASPWDLATALAQPKSVVAGSIVYLHGGTYPGAFSAELVGAPDSKVVVRSYPGEWAVIDGAPADTSTGTFDVRGSNTVYRDFEITNSNPDRYGGRSPGLSIYGAGVEIVNLIVHDGGGNGFWNPAIDAVMYGNLIYHNGFDADDRPHGHAIYTQNTEGTKEIAENIVFGNYSFGVHAYTEGGQIRGFDFIGNIWFGASIAAAGSGDPKDNFLIGGPTNPAGRLRLSENIGYAPAPSHRSVRLGYSAANDDVALENNDFIGRTDFSTPWSSIELESNRFYGDVDGVDNAAYPNNEYGPPVVEPLVFVRGNRYDPGRAHVAIYNPSLEPDVAVDLSAVIETPSHFVVHNAQDYFADPIAEGVYEGGTIQLPMAGLMAVQPVGNPEGIDPSEQTGPAFQVFIVRATPCQ